jgi:hypothetical protein
VKGLSDLIPGLLTLLLALLNKQKSEESKQLKVALKSEIHCNFIESDEEDDEESEEEGIQSKLNTLNTILSSGLSKLYEKVGMDDDYDYSNEVMIMY